MPTNHRFSHLKVPWDEQALKFTDTDLVVFVKEVRNREGEKKGRKKIKTEPDTLVVAFLFKQASLKKNHSLVLAFTNTNNDVSFV